MPLLSRAVTVMVSATPAVAGVGKPVTINVAAGSPAGLTMMPVCDPVMLLVAVAVSDCVPAVFSVALKVCTPASVAV